MPSIETKEISGRRVLVVNLHDEGDFDPISFDRLAKEVHYSETQGTYLAYIVVSDTLMAFPRFNKGNELLTFVSHVRGNNELLQSAGSVQIHFKRDQNGEPWIERLIAGFPPTLNHLLTLEVSNQYRQEVMGPILREHFTIMDGRTSVHTPHMDKL